MVLEFIAALERPVSRVRLENYRRGNSDLEMVVNYFFNVELSEALYPSLQAFEVAFRNSIHATLASHFQSPYWFDESGLLPAWQSQQIQNARDKLTRASKRPDADRIVAELSFGFWHSLLNSPFERGLWRPNRSALLVQVFPQIPRRYRSRQHVWDRCDRIRIIRNRVMHFEPVWSRPHLTKDHADILETLRWMSIDMHDTIAMCDRFPQVHALGRASMEKRIRAEIQRRYSPTQ